MSWVVALLADQGDHAKTRIAWHVRSRSKVLAEHEMLRRSGHCVGDAGPSKDNGVARKRNRTTAFSVDNVGL